MRDKALIYPHTHYSSAQISCWPAQPGSRTQPCQDRGAGTRRCSEYRLFDNDVVPVFHGGHELAAHLTLTGSLGEAKRYRCLQCCEQRETHPHGRIS